MATGLSTAAGITRLVLPPVYRGVAVLPPDDPFEVALGLAGKDATDASFVWSSRTDRAECAVVLAPDRPLAEARLVLYVAMNGIADALGAVVPPSVGVTFGWPDRIEVDGGTAGGIRLAWPHEAKEDKIPDWMVLGLAIRIVPDPSGLEPGHQRDRTTLHDEGCGDLEALPVLESFARHFLYWINRWQDDGFGAIATSWLARASGREDPALLGAGELRAEGTVLSLDDFGGLVVRTESGRVTLPLAGALAAAREGE